MPGPARSAALPTLPGVGMKFDAFFGVFFTSFFTGFFTAFLAGFLFAIMLSPWENATCGLVMP